MKTKEQIIDLVDKYWKFDESQQPMSSWHDKQDLLKLLAFELTEKESEVKTAEEQYTKNDIDLAYLTGVFNTSGIDATGKEIERLKKIGKKPHDIFSKRNKELSQFQQPEKEQPSDDRKIATPKVIFERLKLMYNNGDTQCRAFVAEICDEILDKTGGLLGDIRDSQFPQEIKSK